jgi:vacuolar-type H+-ATPase subunit E/Vma4
MPLANILQALEAEAERRVAEIEQAAQAEITQIHAQAQADAVVAQQKQHAAITAPLRAEQARILNHAKLKALQIVQGTRENLMRAVLEATTRRLAELTSTAAYTEILRQLTQEAVDTLGANGQVCLRVQSDDVALIKRITQELGLSVTITGGLEHEDSLADSGGGLVASTPDGRISLLNTPAVRLRRVASLYRAQIAELLFDAPPEG